MRRFVSCSNGWLVCEEVMSRFLSRLEVFFSFDWACFSLFLILAIEPPINRCENSTEMPLSGYCELVSSPAHGLGYACRQSLLLWRSLHASQIRPLGGSLPSTSTKCSAGHSPQFMQRCQVSCPIFCL